MVTPDTVDSLYFGAGGSVAVDVPDADSESSVISAMCSGGSDSVRGFPTNVIVFRTARAGHTGFGGPQHPVVFHE